MGGSERLGFQSVRCHPVRTGRAVPREFSGLRTGPLPKEKWLADLERIERAVARMPTHLLGTRVKPSYTLREHIALVRGAVLARTSSPPVAAG